MVPRKLGKNQSTKNFGFWFYKIDSIIHINFPFYSIFLLCTGQASPTTL
jgi:hypothetical protein